MLDELCEQAAIGRGLWIGIAVPDEVRACPGLTPWMPMDAHLTLLHLGKDGVTGRERAQDAYDACQHAGNMPELWPQSLEITGYGWLLHGRWQPSTVALVNGPRLAPLRAFLHAACRRWCDKDRYGFIPHVTMQRPDVGEKDDRTGQRHMLDDLEHAAVKRAWRSASLEVHCGSAHLRVQAVL